MESTDEQPGEIKKNNSCVHLNAVADAAANSYELVLAYYVTCIADNALNRKAADAYCCICNATNKRLHACLECAFFGCSNPYDEENLKSHLKDHAEENGHYFAVNINHGCLFCFQCNDYIYNEAFEDILNFCKMEAIRTNDRNSYGPWTPKPEEIAVLKNKVLSVSPDSNIGLRGIVNIGNSCYINCLIQVFVHNPLMRDFFFGDTHICFKKKSESCLTCEMFFLFQEFYSGIQLPHNPIRFFGALQRFSAALLGQQQDDSYLLYQEILQGLLNSCQEIHEPDDCSCAVHQMFYGIIQNNIKCSNCEKSSLLPDEHFVDILLDLKDKTDSIAKILERQFGNPEELIDYKCSGCKKINTASAYHIIRKLPTVICFRLNCVSESLTKKSTAFEFEEWIDMSPYLISNGDIKFPDNYRYCLFGVVFHKGESLDQGHYSVFVRQFKNRWYECNDASVLLRSSEEVFKSEPFLLFYYKFS